MRQPPAAMPTRSQVVIIERWFARDATSGRPFQPSAAATARFCLAILNSESVESITDTLQIDDASP